MIGQDFQNLRGPRLRIRIYGNGLDPIVSTMGTQEEPTANTLPAKEFSIDDDMTNVADSSSFTIANPDGVNADKIIEGMLVSIDESDLGVAGGQWVPQMTGRVTSVESGSDNSGGSVLLVGMMDLGWHLTSCDAVPLTGTEGITIDQLIKRLIDPSWGFASTVATSNVLNRTLKQGRQGVLRQYIPPLQRAALPHIQVEPGQKPFEILKTYCERQGMLINVGAKGDIILFQPDYAQDAAYASYYYPVSDARSQNNNVIGRPSLRRTIDGVYSEVQCWSTVVKPTIVQEAELGLNPNAMYRHRTFTPSTNPLPFKRRLVFSDSEAINDTMMKNRATFKWQMEAWNSWTYEVEFNAHSQAGTFFTSDSMISVHDGVNGVPPGAYYVQKVNRSYTMSGGVRSRLTIRRPIFNPTLQAQTGGGATNTTPKPQSWQELLK